MANVIWASSSVAPELTFWRAKQSFCSSKNELRLVQRSKLGVRIIPEINVCTYHGGQHTVAQVPPTYQIFCNQWYILNINTLIVLLGLKWSRL